MAYTGERKPRGDEPEQWKLFFSKNPSKGDEFPEQFRKYFAQESIERQKTKKTKQKELNEKKLEVNGFKEPSTIIEEEEPPKYKTVKYIPEDVKGSWISGPHGLDSTYWSESLQGIVNVIDVDKKGDAILIHIQSFRTLSTSEFKALKLKHIRKVSKLDVPVPDPNKNLAPDIGHDEIDIAYTSKKKFMTRRKKSEKDIDS